MKLSPTIILTGVFGLVVTPVLAQGSSWLPVPQTGSVTITQVSQEATRFCRGPNGTARGALPFGDLEQNTSWIRANYGIADALAVDGRLGRSTVEAGGPFADDEQERQRRHVVGLTWRVVDEDVSETGMPSVALRFGIDRAGDYDVGMPHAIGDGGVEMSAHSARSSARSRWRRSSGSSR